MQNSHGPIKSLFIYCSISNTYLVIDGQFIILGNFPPSLFLGALLFSTLDKIKKRMGRFILEHKPTDYPSSALSLRYVVAEW